MRKEREDGAAGAAAGHPEPDTQAAVAGVTRSQHQLHIVPEDWDSAAAVLAPMIERIDASSGAAQLLVVTRDVDAAAGLARRLSARAEGVRVLAGTDARRTLRAHRAHPAQVLVATPEVLVHLIEAALLKLGDVRVIALAWVDELDHGGSQALEAIMSEAPKDAPRIVLASDATPAVEQLVERYARRARRVQPAGVAGQPTGPVSLSYLAVGDVARPMALRRVLDALDPASAFIATRSGESRSEVEAQLRSLGYGGERSPVRAGDTPEGAAELLLLYDLPESAERLRALTGAPGGGRVVAFVAPRQLATLRRWAGGSVSPLSLPDAALRARAREDQVRQEVSATLASGGYSRELLALEPLLEEHDGIEIAAALLRLLEQERTGPKPDVAAAPTMTKIFLNVGEMDGTRAGDLVGAITNEAGVGKSDIGRVEVRERFSTVEVATAVANAVVSKITGATIKGRRVMAKIDEGRERRDSGGGRGERKGGARRERPSTRPTRRPPTRPR